MFPLLASALNLAASTFSRALLRASSGVMPPLAAFSPNSFNDLLALLPESDKAPKASDSC